MLNFVGQHHTGGISYTSINSNGYFQGIDALCKHTISLTKFTSFFQFAGEVSNSHMYQFPQKNIYSYIMIADSGCPNYQITAVVFVYFQVGWGGGGVV
jgi:hypothetical protein